MKLGSLGKFVLFLLCAALMLGLTGCSGSSTLVPAVPQNQTFTPSTSPSADTSSDKYVGNTGLMRFHNATCNLVTKLSPTERISFSTREEAIGYGYDPCKVCRP